MKKFLDGKTAEPVELQVRSFKKTMKTRDMVNQTKLLQHNITIEYLPHGSDMPYRIIVGNNPVNRIDPLGLYWFRQDWQTPGVVGRPGTPVPPGGAVSEFIEQNVPAGYTFGEMHDSFVGAATNAGLPDLLVNIPSMIPTYGIAIGTEVLRTLGILDQPAPPAQPTCK